MNLIKIMTKNNEHLGIGHENTEWKAICEGMV